MLTELELISIVTNPENELNASSRDLQNACKLHVDGLNFTGALKLLVGYENAEQFIQKKELCKPFTKPLLKFIIDNQSRWKTAQGTSKFYKFKGDNSDLQKRFEKEILSKVWKGESIKKFINDFLSKAIYTEFNGYFIVEKGKIENVDGIKYEIKNGKKYAVSNDYEPIPYIIFKRNEDIHNYSLCGNKVDWLCYVYAKFKRNKNDVIQYRIIDEKFDYIIEKVNNKTVTIIKESTIEHKAGQTPVVPVSTLDSKLGSEDQKTSPIDSLIPLLDYYLNQYSDHVVSCLKYSYPMYYQIGQKCTHNNGHAECDGGNITWENDKGERVLEKCTACKGTGANIHKDASTAIILPATTQTGDPFNISNVIGFETPIIDILNQQMIELDSVKNEILQSANGQITSQNLNSKTATETVLNLKPLEDIIGGIIDIIESVEHSLTNIVGKMYYGDKYESCEIIYGRKLNLRDENLILEEIKSAKANGASYHYIKTLVYELIYSRFAKSESDLQRNIIAVELEPFIGFNYDEIERSSNITQVQKFIKQNFTEYFQLLELNEGDVLKINKGQEFNKRILFMKDEIKKYALEDIINQQKQIKNDTSGKN